MQHHLGIRERGVKAGQVRAGHRVDEHGAGAAAAQLDQEGAVPVPEAGRALRIHGDRPFSPGQGVHGLAELGDRGDQGGRAIPRLEQQDRLGGLAVAGRDGFTGRGRLSGAGRGVAFPGWHCGLRA